VLTSVFPIRPGRAAAAGLAIVALCLLGQPSALAAPPKYKLTVIPRLDYHEAIPRQITEAGHVLGWLLKDDQPLHMFLYQDGTTTDLQTAAGEIFHGSAINEQGVVVGSIGNQAFTYEDGEYVALQTPGYELTRAIDINASGQIVGWAEPLDGGGRRIFLYDDGVISILPMAGFLSMSVAGISDSGIVAGSGDLNEARNPERHPYIYLNGETIDVGSLGRNSAYSIAVNDAGRVTGVLDKDPEHRNTHAFVRSASGVMRDLGTLGGTNSYAEDINSSGRVVGAAALPTGYFRAFLYRNGAMHDLGALDGENSVAYDITDNGQVVGDVRYENSRSTVFIQGIDGPTTYDLNDLIDPADPLEPFVWLEQTSSDKAMNESGQILAVGSDSRRRRRRGYIVSPVDSTPPVVTADVTGIRGNRGWYTSDVAVSWITADPEAPVGAVTGCETATVVLDSPGTRFDCQARSIGGTSPVNSVTIRRDASSPSVVITSPAPDAVYERNQVVPVAFECTDALSGVQACRGSALPGSLIDTSIAVTGERFRAVGIDKAGNKRVVLHTYSVN
jgi:probable HAF family extracellular repeat protein